MEDVILTISRLAVVAILGLMAKMGGQPREKQSYEYERADYLPLTKEQIDKIHEEGRMTARERVAEWERKHVVCAPIEFDKDAKKKYCGKYLNCMMCKIAFANNMDKEVLGIPVESDNTVKEENSSG